MRTDQHPHTCALTDSHARIRHEDRLLKKKSDALTMKIRQILKLIVENKHVMGDAIAQANWALTVIRLCLWTLNVCGHVLSVHACVYLASARPLGAQTHSPPPPPSVPSMLHCTQEHGSDSWLTCMNRLISRACTMQRALRSSTKCCRRRRRQLRYACPATCLICLSAVVSVHAWICLFLYTRPLSSSPPPMPSSHACACAVCICVRTRAGARAHTHTQVRIQVRLSTKVDNVAGVKIPVFQRVDVDAKDSSALVGLARGGQKLEDARTSFKKALDSLVVLASLQTSYVALDAAQKLTNRRVNALEYVVIPRLEDTVCACVCVRAWGPARVDTPAPPLALRCRHIRCGISRPSSMKWNARTS